MLVPDKQEYRALLELARCEDFGSGDITSEATIPAEQNGCGRIVYRQGGIVAGMAIVPAILEIYNPDLQLEIKIDDGQPVQAGQTAGVIAGPLRALLAAERVVLNFLQRLSGIATLTDKFVQAAVPSSAKICDTRKTTPGWRALEKYAVRCGGGINHRMGLYDAVLIKDNHLAAIGAENFACDLALAIEKVRSSGKNIQFIQVEVDNFEQLNVVLGIDGIDIVLLDNMTTAMMAQAVKARNQLAPAILLEASGGIKLQNIPAIAATGIDRISIGALTHSAVNLDIGLDI